MLKNYPQKSQWYKNPEKYKIYQDITLNSYKHLTEKKMKKLNSVRIITYGQIYNLAVEQLKSLKCMLNIKMV